MVLRLPFHGGRLDGMVLEVPDGDEPFRIACDSIDFIFRDEKGPLVNSPQSYYQLIERELPNGSSKSVGYQHYYESESE
jgi:hypothetical protein